VFLPNADIAVAVAAGHMEGVVFTAAAVAAFTEEEEVFMVAVASMVVEDLVVAAVFMAAAISEATQVFMETTVSVEERSTVVMPEHAAQLAYVEVRVIEVAQATVPR
jgi:hypothetical protein